MFSINANRDRIFYVFVTKKYRNDEAKNEI